ncbi:MAG: TIM barrel protein [Lentisphaeria bacterium]|jgi:hydroxypyruvate isomerase|nr:TIM barrel protein [Lentisphaeria bacterium]
MPVKREVEKIGAGIKIKLAVMSGWFPDLSHVEMVEQVAAYGFPAFENLGAGKWEDKEAVRDKCAELGVSVGAISSSGTIVGDGPVNPAFHDTFEAEIRTAIANAQALGTKTILALTGAQRSDMSLDEQMANVAKAAKRVAPMLEDAGMVMTFETLNIKKDHKGYALVYSNQAADLIRSIGSPAVKFLFDVYHQQISEGDVIRNLTDFQNEIGHYHFGDNPGRHEPGTGELNYRNIFRAIAATGYTGCVSAEFSKTKELPVEGLLRILADCATF